MTVNPIQKLRSQRGSSMVIAMLFSMVALAIGTVVLASASASASRVQRSWQDQQDQLAITSAVRFIQEDLAGASYSAQYLTTRSVTRTVNTTDPTGSYETRSTTYTPGPDALAHSQLFRQPPTFFSALFQHRYVGVNPGAEPPSLPAEQQALPVSLASEDPGIPPVSGTLTIDAARGREYTLTFQLHLGPPDRPRYETTLVFPASVRQSAEPPVTTVSYPATRDPDVYKTQTITQQVTAAQVTWQPPVVTKGAATP